MPPYLAFSSLDKKSVRFTIPLSTIRRVERLNARAGVYALSLLTWHGVKIVSLDVIVPLQHENLTIDTGCATDIIAPNCRLVLFDVTRRTQG